MPMLHGRSGNVIWTGAGSDSVETIVTNWTADITCDTADTTAMSDVNYWKSHLPGFKGWSATISTNYETGDDPFGTVGETGNLSLLMKAAGDILAGSAICTDCGMAVDKDDRVALEYSFIGSGKPSFTA